MKIKIIILSILVIIIHSSCSPDRYKLMFDTREFIHGYKMNSLDSTEKINENSIQLYSGGMTALRLFDVTQLYADFTVNITGGDGVSFFFRTTKHDFEQENKTGITFDYTRDGCYIRDSGELVAEVDSVKMMYSVPARVKIKNDGRNYLITVDCDTVYRGHTRNWATEYVIVRAMNESNVRLSGIHFENILEDF